MQIIEGGSGLASHCCKIKWLIKSIASFFWYLKIQWCNFILPNKPDPSNFKKKKEGYTFCDYVSQHLLFSVHWLQIDQQ